MKTLIQNVRIVDGGSIADGGILMEDGRIAAILPRGAEVSDAQMEAILRKSGDIREAMDALISSEESWIVVMVDQFAPTSVMRPTT